MWERSSENFSASGFEQDAILRRNESFSPRSVWHFLSFRVATRRSSWTSISED